MAPGWAGSCAAASAGGPGGGQLPPCSDTGGVKSLAVALSFEPEADACSVAGRLGHSSRRLAPASEHTRSTGVERHTQCSSSTLCPWQRADRLANHTRKAALYLAEVCPPFHSWYSSFLCPAHRCFHSSLHHSHKRRCRRGRVHRACLGRPWCRPCMTPLPAAVTRESAVKSQIQTRFAFCNTWHTTLLRKLRVMMKHAMLFNL